MKKGKKLILVDGGPRDERMNANGKEVELNCSIRSLTNPPGGKRTGDGEAAHRSGISTAFLTIITAGCDQSYLPPLILSMWIYWGEVVFVRCLV